MKDQIDATWFMDDQTPRNFPSAPEALNSTKGPGVLQFFMPMKLKYSIARRISKDAINSHVSAPFLPSTKIEGNPSNYEGNDSEDLETAEEKLCLPIRAGAETVDNDGEENLPEPTSVSVPRSTSADRAAAGGATHQCGYRYNV